MKYLQVKDIWGNTDYRFQVIKERFPTEKPYYEKTILFDTDWYETKEEEEADNAYMKVEAKEIMTIRPTKYENGELGLTLVLWN